MTATTPAGRLRVSVVHDYREYGQMSMKHYADQLGAALGAEGLDVNHVVAPDVLPAWARVGLLDKVDSYYGRFVRYPALARALPAADVFHVADHAQSYLIGALDPARVVVTCHDVILLLVAAGRMRIRLRARLATEIFRSALRNMARARGIVAVSENTRRDLAEFTGLDPARVAVIPPGLNHPYRPLPVPREELRQRLGLPGGPLVLQVGQNTFYKNIPGCLRVVARLRKGGTPATFVRLGRPLRLEHRLLAERLGITSAIVELGARPPEDLAAAYCACDVLLFPSLYEGFGWPPIEAMASGLPVVCSRRGSLDEVVGDCALTADPEDVEQLADHVDSVLTRPSLVAHLRARGLERAARFDWKRTAQQMTRYYHQVLGS